MTNSMMFSFKDRVAFVSGGASGIGKDACFSFAKAGAKVAVIDQQKEEGEGVAGAIQKEGGEAIFLRVDVSKPEELDQAVESIVKRWGRLDFAFNNAGIEGTPSPTVDCSFENWQRTLAVNLSGTWYAMRAQIPVMLRQGSGVIVNCSSVAGLVGIEGMPAYVASKHGVVGLTKTAALEYASKGIRINVICPGAIKNPMLDRFMGSSDEASEAIKSNEPIGRIGEPREISQTLLWLCSEGASYVIGQSITVDGGWTAR